MNSVYTKENKLSEISQISPPKKGERLVLHACCAPCNLEPFRILKEAGWDITIMYSNSNIYPLSEYTKRLDELIKWANDTDAKIVSDSYDNASWKTDVDSLPKAPQKTEKRKIRCGACYKHRLKRAAKYAKDSNIQYLASTLAVSPWQYNDVLEEKLIEVCDEYNLKPIFMDFRPYYKNAVERSKELEMYRQKYCGCEFSLEESIEQFKKSRNKKYLEQLEIIKELKM